MFDKCRAPEALRNTITRLGAKKVAAHRLGKLYSAIDFTSTG